MNRKLLLALLTFALLFTTSAFAQQTTIWLVRHAEKQTSEAMMSSDPELSETGKLRAIDLANVLKRYPINAIYSTNYKRTLATAAPLAAEVKVSPVIYDAKDLAGIASKTLQYNKGKQVLIVGHSNTLIPVIKALKAELPFNELTDDDYDMLFKVVVDDNGNAKLTIAHYGKPHHTTEVPPAFKGTF
ncbi:phosphoglycerate mutase family protein [Mucilaginibacter terrae]|uniref:2,3-bisphosphoglycerate-dependent phosphoglycerate mutase n=1 Tax=Mucilaginibacter terrae TaxID=1955052 RepID=A0ABU3GXR0_9SPHI|nr:phosphoglycerate mutase family protein [Mucilaginibacter terrae]MDT3403460.1 2,3-bisphosphoglycerate-dependent phosphoglycerate mutase [Mucilaginibacter terrae]